MANTLIISAGNAPVLQTTVNDSITGLPINDALVEATITDPAGNALSGTSWPIQLTYVPTSPGVYRYQFDAALPVVAGQGYKARFTIDKDGTELTLEYDVYVTPVGTGNTPGSSSPASPAYVGPTTQQLLNEARAAYHKLMTGQTLASVRDQNGEQIQFSVSNRAALQGYIVSLERQLGILSTVGPATVSFDI